MRVQGLFLRPLKSSRINGGSEDALQRSVLGRQSLSTD